MFGKKDEREEKKEQVKEEVKEEVKKEPKKEPIVVIKNKERYVCPDCHEEALTYNEEIGIFNCEKCKVRFALIKVE